MSVKLISEEPIIKRVELFQVKCTRRSGELVRSSVLKLTVFSL